MQNGAFNIEKILGMCERLMYILGVNLCFLISNLPVLLFFLLVGISQVRTYLPLFLLCMVPFGASLSGVFYCMNRLLRNRESKVFRNFWHGYSSDWGQKMRIGFVHMLIILILWTNVEFFKYEIPILPLMILFTILFSLAVLITPTLYLLTARYHMSSRAIVKDAIILMITRPGITLGNVAALGLILMCIEIQPGTAVLFMGSVYGLLVAFMNRHILRELESAKESQ